MIIPRGILLRMRNILDRNCREYQNVYFTSSNNFFFRKTCHLWGNVANFGRAKQVTDDNIIQHMRFEFWTSKATDTHSDYEILIAFPRQQWLRERDSILRYTYIASLVLYSIITYHIVFSLYLSLFLSVSIYYFLQQTPDLSSTYSDNNAMRFNF
jgi:hypothetical protein